MTKEKYDSWVAGNENENKENDKQDRRYNNDNTARNSKVGLNWTELIQIKKRRKLKQAQTLSYLMQKNQQYFQEL